MLELRFHDRIAAIPQASWDALAFSDESPFVEWTWLDCLEQSGCVGGESGWHPFHLGLYDTAPPAAGTAGADVTGAASTDPLQPRLVAAAPMYIKTNSEGEFVFDWNWAEFAHRAGIPYYPKLIAAVPFTPATGARVLLAKELSPDAGDSLVQTLAATLVEHVAGLGMEGLHVLFPTERQVSRFCRSGYLLRHGIQYHWHNRGYGNFEDFLKDLPSKKRTQIRREAREPEQHGIKIETLSSESLTQELAPTLYELYLSTVDKFSWGRRYLNQRFFELLLQRFRERLAFVVARKEKRIVAGALNIRKGKRLYGRYWGSFVDIPFLHYNVCYYHSIRECIEHGILTFEPGAGGEHKKARGFRPTLTYSAHYLKDARLRSVLRDFLERERAAIRSELEPET
jgi:predicted N-acyltransferase